MKRTTTIALLCALVAGIGTVPAAQGAAKPKLTLTRAKAEIQRVLGRRYRAVSSAGQYAKAGTCKAKTRTVVRCLYTVFQRVDDAYSQAYYGGGDQPIARGLATATLGSRGRVTVKVAQPAAIS